MLSLPCYGESLWESPCWLWRQPGQNLSTQCPPRCSLRSSSVCSSCTSEGDAFPDPQLPQLASGYLFLSWVRGQPAALDVTIISTMQPATINGTASTQGHAVLFGEARKLSTHKAACTAVGVSFVPIVMESLGGMSALAVNTLGGIGRLLGQRLGIPTADSIRHLFQNCSISVWRGNAAMWSRRSPTFSSSIDGVF